MNKNIFKKGLQLLTVALVGATSLTSCYEEPEKIQPFLKDEMTIEAMITQRADLSAFNAILKKCAYDKKLATYLEYTCFAPVNEGVSEYLDSLYADNNKRFLHNGIQEAGSVDQFKALDVMDKVALMSDSLCADICKYHMSGELFQQINIDGSTSCNTLLTGRSITAATFESGKYAGMSSLNGTSAIIEGDIEALNGYLQVCSNVIPRSDRTVDDQMSVEGDLNIFSEALQATGLNKIVQEEKKAKKYEYASTGQATNRDGAKLVCPDECLVKWTIFAETDEALEAAGIKTFEDLKNKCIEWYGNPTWYDLVQETGQKISTDDDYENPFNVVNMFVAYHIIRAGMPVDRLVYEKNSRTQGTWNICFGYEPQEYYETLLPNTLLKIWELNPTSANVNNRKLYINRYRQNNTLTDELGTFGSEATHKILFPGVEIDREDHSIETLNGYIHRIKGVLVYDANAVASQKERMRFDSSNFLYELINNGFRFATGGDINAMGDNGDNSRVAFDNTYFDNIYCYNPNTLLRYCVMGAWRANNSDQFQGWDAYDFAIKLPHVPAGTYELRIIYPPMNRGGLMQFYTGKSSNPNDMIAQGIPFDACADPTIAGNVMGCEAIQTLDENENTDYGLETDQIMHVRGYMRAPASFSRGTYNTVTDKLTYDPTDIYSAAKSITGSTSCRSEWGYGTMMLRRVIGVLKLKQSEDLWLRIKNLVNNKELGWSFDFIELCPVEVYGNQQMSEDWY